MVEVSEEVSATAVVCVSGTVVELSTDVVVSTVVGGGFVGEFVRHSLGHLGGHAAGVFGYVVVAAVAVVQPEFASAVRGVAAHVRLVLGGVACGTAALVVGRCGSGWRRLGGFSQALAAACLGPGLGAAVFAVAGGAAFAWSV